MINKFLFFIIFGLLTSAQVFAQGYGKLVMGGRITFAESSGRATNARVVIKENGKQVNIIEADSRGRWQYEFHYDSQFTLHFENDNCYTKIVSVDTRGVPEEAKRFGFENKGWEVEMIWKMPNLDASALNKPIGHFKWVPEEGIFNYDVDYALTVRKSMDDLIAEYERVSIEENKRLKELEKNYSTAISNADKALKSNNYDVAETEFKKALSLKPEETYPQQKIAEIQTALEEQKQQKQLFEQQIAEGDKLLQANNFDAAKQAYNKAAEVLPGNSITADKIKQVDKLKTEQETAEQLAIAQAKKEEELRKKQEEEKRKQEEAEAKRLEEEKAKAEEEKKIAEEAAKKEQEKQLAEAQKQKEAEAEAAAKAEAEQQKAVAAAKKLAEEQAKQEKEKLIAETKKQEEEAQQAAQEEKLKLQAEEEERKAAALAQKEKEKQAALAAANEEEKEKLKAEELAQKQAAENEKAEAQKRAEEAAEREKAQQVAAAQQQKAQEEKLAKAQEEDRLKAIEAEEARKAQEARKKEEQDKARQQAVAKSNPPKPAAKPPIAAATKKTMPKVDDELAFHRDEDLDVKDASYSNKVAQKYPEGVTEYIYQDGNRMVTKRVVVLEGRGTIYRQVKHPWGGVFYFKDNVSITNVIWDRESVLEGYEVKKGKPKF